MEGYFYAFWAILDSFDQMTELVASFQFDLVPESCPETIWRLIFDPEIFGENPRPLRRRSPLVFGWPRNVVFLFEKDMNA